MKSLLCLLLLVSSGFAAEPEKPLLATAGKVITQPDLTKPLGAEWSTGKGKWEAKDGVLTPTEIAEEKHVPVLHLATGPSSLVWECEFRMKDAKIFYVGFDGAAKHVGRVVIQPKSLRLMEDSTEVKGVTPGHTLAETPIDLKPDEWQHLRVEYAGNQMAARLNDHELKAEDPHLATPKVRWWFAAQSTAEIRNVRVSEGQSLATEAK